MQAVRSQFTHASTGFPAKQIPQCRCIGVADALGHGGEIASILNESTRTLNAQVLKKRQRRFAEHEFRPALQRARVDVERIRRVL